MRFSRQEYWRGLPFPSPGELPDPGIKPMSPALQADSLSVLQSGAFHWGAFPTREELKPSKGSGACGTENPTLTEGVCSEVRIYCRAPNKGIGDKPQIYSNLVFEWGFFKKEQNRTFLVVQGLRICLPILGTHVWSHVQEDSTCHGAMKPVCHNYWTRARAPDPQHENRAQWEAPVPQPDSSPSSPPLEKAQSTKTLCAQTKT